MARGLWGPCSVVLAIGVALAALAAAVPPRHVGMVLMAQGVLFLALAQRLRARAARSPADSTPRPRVDEAVVAEPRLAETESSAVKM